MCEALRKSLYQFYLLLFETVSYRNFSPNASDCRSSILVNFVSVSY